MSEELEACPFCGVEVNLQNGLIHYIKHELWCFFGMDRRDRPEKEQVEAWNTRADNKQHDFLKEEHVRLKMLVKGLRNEIDVSDTEFHKLQDTNLALKEEYAEVEGALRNIRDNRGVLTGYEIKDIADVVLPQQEKEE